MRRKTEQRVHVRLIRQSMFRVKKGRFITQSAGSDEMRNAFTKCQGESNLPIFLDEELSLYFCLFL